MKMEPPMLAVTEPMDTEEPANDTEAENPLSENLISPSSSIQTSVMFHDYCGEIDLQSVSHTLNKSVQTNSSESPMYSTTDVAI